MIFYKGVRYILALVIIFYVVLYLSYLITSIELFYKIVTYSYSIIPLVGAILAFLASNLWGSTKSLLGKSLLFIGFGQLFMSLGQNTCHYLRISEGIDKCPYPSYAEFFFVGSIFLYIFGSIYLGISMGVFRSLKANIIYKVFAGVVALSMIWFALYKFMEVNGITNIDDFSMFFHENTYILFALELIYPFGAGIYTAIAILAAFGSANIAKGMLIRSCILVLLGLFMQFTGDTVYIWTTGVVSDGFYLASFVFMSLAGLFFIDSALNIKTNHGGQKVRD